MFTLINKMKFNEDLAAIHGYLCADGYVITNPVTQKHKYYYIGLRNTNDTLLQDFQKRFLNVFGLKPIITNDGRCKIQNKEIFQILTKDFTYYSNRWTFPNLSKQLMRFWLRAYFDCDGWASSIKAKDRKIGLESINERGIIQIRDVLKNTFKIDSTVKKRSTRNIWSLTICGKDDIQKFHDEIGFLHPKKVSKLEEALNSYVSYNWILPNNKKDLINFVVNKGRLQKGRNQIKLLSIMKSNLINISIKLNELGVNSKLLGPWKNSYGSIYYCLIIKLSELNKIGVKKWEYQVSCRK